MRDRHPPTRCRTAPDTRKSAYPEAHLKGSRQSAKIKNEGTNPSPLNRLTGNTLKCARRPAGSRSASAPDRPLRALPTTRLRSLARLLSSSRRSNIDG